MPISTKFKHVPFGPLLGLIASSLSRTVLIAGLRGIAPEELDPEVAMFPLRSAAFGGVFG